MDFLLNHIVKWAEAEISIKALVLIGSRATETSDQYSDFDLAVFCSTYESYINDEKWLSKIAPLWVCVHEKVTFFGKTFPTRLAIFEKGVKVDFAFYTLDILHDLVKCKLLPEDYNRGYVVLHDKDGLASRMPKATFKANPAQKPSEEEFLRIINEFWFEIHHVVKYLKRGDLWSAKFRSWSIYENFLLKMIEWHKEAKLHWTHPVPPLGKRMHSWVDEQTWISLHKVFAHFDREDSVQALRHLMDLFRALAVETANRLAYPYPHELDKKMSLFASGTLFL